MKSYCIVMAIIVYVLMAHSLEATTFYTRTSGGDDSRSCSTAQTSGTAKKTINGGVSCLSAGDTLIVGNGIYTDVVLWYYWGHQRSGTAGNPITIKAENFRGAIVKPGAPGMGQGLGGGRNIFAFENQNYWTVDGFVTDGTGMSGVIHYNSVGTVGLTIKNFEARFGADNNSGSNTLGISTDVGDDQLTIQDFYIHDIGTGAAGGQSFYSYGMYFTGTNSVIERGEISNCSGHGMHMHNTQGNTSGNTMRNVVIHHNGIPSGQAPGVLWASGGYNNVMYQNVIYSNGGSGVRLGGAGSYGADNTVSQNTIYDNGSECIIVGSGYGNDRAHIQNNICYANHGSDNIVLNNTNNNTIDHNFCGTAGIGCSVTGNPSFVNPGQDFHLNPGSGAIDAGTPILSLAYVGAAPDQGAFETGGVVSAELPRPINFTVGVTP